MPISLALERGAPHRGRGGAARPVVPSDVPSLLLELGTSEVGDVELAP